MRARALHRLRASEGFTLVEMLVATTIGMVVILAAYGLLDISGALALKASDRVDATQRGRRAMDQITSELRSQVCLGAGQPAITDGQSNQVSFYTFTGAGAFAPELHTIKWDTSTRTIVEYDYVGTGSPPNMTYSSTPTRTNTLLTDVTPLSNVPVFSYYTWSAGSPVTPSTPLTAPLSQSDEQNVVRIVVQFVTTPANHPTSQQTTPLQDEVFARTADPNSSNGSNLPQCG